MAFIIPKRKTELREENPFETTDFTFDVNKPANTLDFKIPERTALSTAEKAEGFDTSITPKDFASSFKETYKSYRDFVGEKTAFLLPTEDEIKTGGITKYGGIVTRDPKTNKPITELDVIGWLSLGTKSRRLIDKTFKKIMDKADEPAKELAKKLMSRLVGETDEKAIKEITQNLDLIAKGKLDKVSQMTIPSRTQKSLGEIFAKPETADSVIHIPEKGVYAKITPAQLENLKDEVKNIPFTKTDRPHLTAMTDNLVKRTREVSLDEIKELSPNIRKALDKAPIKADDITSQIAKAKADGKSFEEWVKAQPNKISGEFYRYETAGTEANKVKFFSDKMDYVDEYKIVREQNGKTGKVIKENIDLKNPLIVEAKLNEFSDPSFEKQFIDKALKNGNDGVVFKSPDNDIFVAKLPKSQLKQLWDKAGVKKPIKKVKTGKEQLAKREAAKLAREGAKIKKELDIFYEEELENQYQSFKKLVTPKKLEKIEDATQFKNKLNADSKINLKPEELDNILYSQEKTQDEVFDMFVERRLRETEPLPKVPKETKAIVAEKARQQIKDAKEILNRRRNFIKAAQKQFGLSDADLKKISKKDIRLMNNYEFHKYITDFRAKAAQLADTRQAKLQVLSQIKEKELQKVDSLRKAMKLPSIDKMTVEELGKLDKILSEAEFGDIFLTQRQLETVKNTDLAGIKTLREAREALAKELNVSFKDLDNIKVSELDKFRFDTALAEKNDFYKMMVENTHGNMLKAEKNYLDLENEINNLVTKARNSRKRGLKERLVPTDKRVFAYMSGETKLAEKMTSEELELANFLQVKFADALDYLVKNEVLKHGREDYITNTRRGFLEAVTDDGLIQGIKEIFDKQKQDLQVFEILDSKTKEVLPLEKFFQFSLQRTGGINPTKNVAKAAQVYFRTLEKKKALDALIPKLMIFVDSLTPQKLTPRGLEMDDSLKTFVKQWINTKKGRKTQFIAKQGGAVDIALNTIRSFLYIKDLGFNIPVGIASTVGEQVATFVNLGNRQYLKGIKRLASKQGRQIVKDYTEFIGKSVWSELKEPSKNIGDQLTETMFGAFANSARQANKIHLLGSLTDEEFKAGKIATKRLAEMKLEIGKFRMLEGAKSIIGATTEGSVFTQYKTWAIPIFRTITKDLTTISKKLAKGNFKETITSRELKEVARAVEVTLAVIYLGNKYIDEDDDSFLGNLSKKLYREALTVAGALDTKAMLAAPRLISFVENMGQAVSNIVKLEEYKTKEGLIGVEQLKRELRPALLRQFDKKEDKGKRTKELEKIFGGGTQKRKSLDEIFKD